MFVHIIVYSKKLIKTVILFLQISLKWVESLNKIV